jgi:hypothetical protein
MAGKKFSETKVGQFLLNKIPNVVSSLAGNTPVASAIKAIIGGSEMSDADKELALKKLELEKSEFEGITQRWVADAKSGSWLAVNVRPVTLIFFSLSYVLGWYMGYPLDNISSVLQLIVGAYFGSRGAEKVFGNKMHK